MWKNQHLRYFLDRKHYHNPGFDGQTMRLVAYNTCQVKDYSRYELGGFSEEAKHQWRDAHWEEDLQKAYDAGRQMADA